MKKHVHLTEELKQEIYKRWLVGFTHKELAKLYNLSYSRISAIINKMLISK